MGVPGAGDKLYQDDATACCQWLGVVEGAVVVEGGEGWAKRRPWCRQKDEAARLLEKEAEEARAVPHALARTQ